MSIKRRLQAQADNLSYAVRNFALPHWATDVRARVILCGVFVLFAAGYIFKTGSVAISGYEIHNLENQVAALENEIQKLDTEVITYSSIQNIQKRVKGTNMVAVGQIIHLSPAASVVAVK